MKVLLAHNHYGDHAMGGEAMVFNTEAELLQNNNILVHKYEKSNSSIEKQGIFGKIEAVKSIHWSKDTIEEAGRIMDEFKPDILHVHNYKFVITPSIFKAAKDRGIRTVLTLHNYRLMVPCGNFMTKEGKVCERCVTQSPLNILVRRCAQGSFLKSYLQYRLFTKTKHELKQLIELVDAYIVLTHFAKNKLEQTGVPGKKIHVKPNFITPLANLLNDDRNERAVFIGRLSFEKGISKLIENWQVIDYPLYIIGSGPLEKEISQKVKGSSNIILMGDMENEDAKRFLSESAFMVFPSSIYESFGLTIIEAMAAGIPIIATALGPRKEIIKDGITGMLYDVENNAEFKIKVNQLIANKNIRERMGNAAQKEYYSRFTPEENFIQLNKLYNELLLQ